MADYDLKTRINPFLDGGIGGAGPNNKITQTNIEKLINLDRLCQCGRFQTLYSMVKAFDTTPLDSRPLRGFQTNGSALGANVIQILGQFYYTVPDLLPGSDGASTSSGSGIATQGGLVLAACLENAAVSVTMEKINIAGSHGQSSTYSGTAATGNIVNFTATRLYLVDDILFPVGTTEGDVFEIIIWVGSNNQDGIVQYLGIHEPAAMTA